MFNFIKNSNLYSKMELAIWNAEDKIKDKVYDIKEHPVKNVVNIATTAAKIYATTQVCTLPNYRQLRLVANQDFGFMKNVMVKSTTKRYLSVFGINYATEKLNQYNNKINDKNSKFNAVENILTTNMINSVYKCTKTCTMPIAWANHFPNESLSSATKLLISNPNSYIPEFIDASVGIGVYGINKINKKDKNENRDSGIMEGINFLYDLSIGKR